jgi:hypothetical protein
VGEKLLKVVYDCDDVLWDLNTHVANLKGIDPDCLVNFAMLENEALTMPERRAMLDGFRDAASFVDIKFYDGANEILRAEKLGATVMINSNAYNADIAELKRQQLVRLLPEMAPEKMRINVIDPDGACHKEIERDLFIFVDDSPFNIALSEAKINIMPTRLWNVTPKAKEIVREKNVIWIDDLTKINQFVRETLAKM